MGSRNTNARKSNKGAGIGCCVVALLVIGGCSSVLGIGDEDSTTDTENCSMAPVGEALAPERLIGGGGNGGRGGWGSSGGSSGGGSWGDGSSGGSTSGGSSTSGDLGDVNTPDYEPGMDPADITHDMRTDAELYHGDVREVGDEWIYFDKRTGKPFPWHEKAYRKAKKAAREASERAASESACE